MQSTRIPSLDEPQAWPAKRRVTLVGLFVNVVLSAGKIVGGLVGQSQALIVDGVHSASDLASDFLVLWAARAGARAADFNHPYGHRRFETAAALAIGALLLLVAGGFAYDAVLRWLQPEFQGSPGWLALSLAVSSVAIKEALYRYTLRVAVRYRSELMHANAWHHRSDALSSIVVIVGVAGAMAGLPWLDPAAAFVVALMVGWVGWRLSWNAVQELVDTGLAPAQLQALAQAIDSTDGVRGHRDLRTRRMASATLVDVCILVDPHMSVAAASVVRHAVAARLRERFEEIAEVLVRVDAWESPPRREA